MTVESKVDHQQSDDCLDDEKEFIHATKDGKEEGHWFIRLFFTRKFIVHRLTGLMYLIQWTLALSLYFLDYETFIQSPLVWTVPVSGVIQSVTAIYTFTFLPRKADPGITYLSDKSALSYFFIVENSFFELLLMYQ